MAGSNTKRTRAAHSQTFEGARAMREDPVSTLRRVLFAHMLFEDTFYMDGADTANLLKQAVKDATEASDLATQSVIIQARHEMNIRHASLMAAVEFAKITGGFLARDTIFGVIQRADEIPEVISMAGGKKGMTHGIRKGVAMAFRKFDEYQLAKYQAKGKQFTLRDAVFLTHPSPKDTPLVQKIVDGTLEVPNTWETRLSGGENKKAAFTDLLAENKLGAMALLRNLRGMNEAGVSRMLINKGFENANWSRVLPFRFMSAAQHAPAFAGSLDIAFKKAVAGSVYLKGRTAVLLDTSGSMATPISAKSTVRSYQGGAVLAAAINGDEVDLYQWADRTEQMANWNSLSSAMGVRSGAVGWGTNIRQAIDHANRKGDYDRLIVITDMQFGDNQMASLKKGQHGYTINTRPYGNAGLMMGEWTHLSGWSDQVLRYIAEVEDTLP